MATSDSKQKNNVSTFATKTKIQCFICGKTGHFKKGCWHGQRNNQGLQRGRNRDTGQGHSRGESSNNFSSESWTGQVSNPKINQVCESDKNKEFNFLLDSECTDHVINNDTDFYNFIEI